MNSIALKGAQQFINNSMDGLALTHVVGFFKSENPDKSVETFRIILDIRAYSTDEAIRRAHLVCALLPHVAWQGERTTVQAAEVTEWILKRNPPRRKTFSRYPWMVIDWKLVGLVEQNGN